MTRGLDRGEINALRAAGTRVVRIEPSQEDLQVMGPNFMEHRRWAAVFETALQTTPAQVRAALTEGVRP